MPKQVNKVIFGGQTIMDVSDATASASEILEGKTAYGANGEKMIGTYRQPVIPVPTASDNGKVLIVKNGIYALVTAKEAFSLIIPDDYQQVEYIESVGGSNRQWIDTDVQIEAGLEFYIDFKAVSYGVGKYLMGTYYRNDFFLYFASSGEFQTAFGSTWKNTTLPGDTDRHNFEYILTSDALNVYDNGTNILSTDDLDFTSSPTIKIAGMYNSSGVASSVRTYSAKIIRNGHDVRNLIPCYRKSDNIVGMYDTVSKQFYTNSGTGSFSKGSDVL